MECTEIDSFVNKFRLLWTAGHDASLTLESKLGEVYVSLNCKVGRIVPPSITLTVAASPKFRSPSYSRRQIRRKAACISQSDNVVKDCHKSR